MSIVSEVHQLPVDGPPTKAEEESSGATWGDPTSSVPFG